MADFEIHGRSFEFPKSESSAAVVRDGQYFKLKSERYSLSLFLIWAIYTLS